MTQDLSLKSPNTETSVASEGATVLSVSIADPYVLLRMNDGSIQLLVGGMSGQVCCLKINLCFRKVDSYTRLSSLYPVCCQDS